MTPYEALSHDVSAEAAGAFAGVLRCLDSGLSAAILDVEAQRTKLDPSALKTELMMRATLTVCCSTVNATRHALGLNEKQTKELLATTFAEAYDHVARCGEKAGLAALPRLKKVVLVYE